MAKPVVDLMKNLEDSLARVQAVRPGESHSEWTRRVGGHCAVCGGRVSLNGKCVRGDGLACRADTTDPVAPDPPCYGYRSQSGRPYSAEDATH